MASNVKVNGTWKTTSTVYTKVNGTWKTVANAYTKVNGTWKQWLAPAAPPPPPVGPPPPPPPIISYPPPPGGGTTYYSVPYVIGLAPSAASAQITGSGNYYGGSVATVTTNTSSQDGTVAAQYPTSGTYTSPQTVTISTYSYSAPVTKTVTSDTTTTDCAVIGACPSGYENIRTIRYSDGSFDSIAVCCTPPPPPPPPACTCNYSYQSYTSGCYYYYYYFAPECCAPNCCPNYGYGNFYIGCPPPPPPPPIISYPPPPPPPIISYPPPPPPPIISYPPPPPPPIISYPPPPPPPPTRGGCFVGSTLISTPNGYVKAEDITVGSLVHSVRFNELSLDETTYTLPNWSTETLTPTMITKAMVKSIVVRKQVTEYLDLNGDFVTPEHRVLVHSNGVYSFKEAGDVHIGDLILRRDGDQLSNLIWEPVTRNNVIQETAMVYLFDTEEDDVIFSKAMLSHNIKASSYA